MKTTLKIPETEPLPPQGPLPFPGLQPIRVPADLCRDFEKASVREWVITNGRGGYASSTILGMNSRRYHGLLVAAVHPPVDRRMMLSKVEETLVTPSGRYELSTNQYGTVVHPEGYRYLEEFRLDPWPTFFFRVGELLLRKSIFMLPGENATVVAYTLLRAPSAVELWVRPQAAGRDFRALCRENDDLSGRVEESPGSVILHLYDEIPPLVLHHNAELVERSPCWYKNFEYLQESREGSPTPPAHGGPTKIREDLWSFGVLRYLLKVGETCTLVASTGRRGTVDFAFHERRLENTQTVLAQTISSPGAGPLSLRLSWTADSFTAAPFLRPGAAGETYLLAGYPWFVPWGRDTLVALPGLTLCTGRYELARQLLQTLGSQVEEGLLPVRYREEDGSAEYDSADTSLWFFWAVWHYWRTTRDIRFIGKKLLDPLQEIMEGYLKGTRYGIGMDEDGLIRLGDDQMPLTWMDARLPAGQAGKPASGTELPGRAVTVRSGKPVEINALWFNALMVMATLLERLGLKRARSYSRLAKLVQQNFVRNFFAPTGFLYDRISDAGPDPSLRANMLIAVSLPFCPLSKAQALGVLAVAEKELLTPAGVRTLSPNDPNYRGRFEGDLRQRALAYHQGTIWTWLTGPYVSAVCQLRGLTRSTQGALARQMKPYLQELEERCLGSVAELRDGEAPHTPRGGLSQAWSTGELLRAIRQARLGGL